MIDRDIDKRNRHERSYPLGGTMDLSLYYTSLSQNYFSDLIHASACYLWMSKNIMTNAFKGGRCTTRFIALGEEGLFSVLHRQISIFIERGIFACEWPLRHKFQSWGIRKSFHFRHFLWSIGINGGAVISALFLHFGGTEDRRISQRSWLSHCE